jgi:hypothetical protein
MKTSLLTIISAAAILLAACQVQAGMVNSNSVIEDGIEYYIQTDKFTYNLGENVEILFRVTNLRDEILNIGNDGSVEDISIVGKNGEDSYGVWRNSWIYPSPPGTMILRLQAGESKEFSVSWLQIDAKGTFDPRDDTAVPTGIYRISGIIYGNEGYYPPKIIDESVSVDITIVPEPATLLFLGMGAVALRVRKYVL